MDDLDALLADLQTTTQKYQQCQSPRVSSHSSFTDSLDSGSAASLEFQPSSPPSKPQRIVDEPPPPKAPPPSRNNSLIPQQTQLYQQAQTQQAPQLQQAPQPQQAPQLQQTPQPQPAMSSALSNNLSELDNLLQDLNSAQFLAEMDRRSGGYSVVQPNPSRNAPPIAPKPPRRDSSNSRVQDLQNQSTNDSDENAYEQQYVHPQNPAGASTATRELDDLLSSLAEFKMTQGPNNNNIAYDNSGRVDHNTEPSYAVPNKPKTPPQNSPQPHPNQQPMPQHQQSLPQNQNRYHLQQQQHQQSIPQHQQSIPQHQQQQNEYDHMNQQYQDQNHQHEANRHDPLDSMLDGLKEDLHRQGVTTTAKGHCYACNDPIMGQVITALGRMYHPVHFVCAHCNVELGTGTFFERDGRPFCETDYHNLFSPKCAYCSQPILDRCVTALDKTWHPEHFFCAECGGQFDETGFHEKNGLPYCRDDYFDKFAPKCGGCATPIMDNYISALNKQWHHECFICQDCHMPFAGGSFFDHEGMPYCETHYHAKRGSLCAGCNKPITGRCITAMYKKFHPEHFVCAFCLKQLNKGTFKEQDQKSYCHACFVKLFG